MLTWPMQANYNWKCWTPYWTEIIEFKICIETMQAKYYFEFVDFVIWRNYKKHLPDEKS